MSKKVGQVSKKIRQNPTAREKALEFFFENPQARPTVREQARVLGLTRSTLQYHLLSLREEGLISDDNRWLDSWLNRLKKVHYYVEKICQSGLIDYLDVELGSSAIILFGSFRKGEFAAESDIDIFVECPKEKELHLQRFEKLLGHKIQVFTKPKITLLPAPLLNNVVNGIKLKGYFTIK